MLKKFLIICGFLAIFGISFAYIWQLQNKSDTPQIVAKQPQAITAEEPTLNQEPTYTYTRDTLSEQCASDDNIFCAVELAVKCTINPDFIGCDKNSVPAFVLGKSEEVERPSEISFKIIKLKPIAESSDISVYTQSDCNALWFGLCKGTVIYALTPKNETGWKVSNIFAIE